MDRPSARAGLDLSLTYRMRVPIEEDAAHTSLDPKDPMLENTSDRDVATIPCPLCREEIIADAAKCKHCGEFLDGRRAPRDHSAGPVFRFVFIALLLFVFFIVFWGLPS